MSAGVTAIEPSHLTQVAKPLCMWSGPLVDPPPAYSPAADAVQCWQHVTFGKHDWPLPPVLSTHDDLQARVAVFATALLEGRVLSVFQGMSHVFAGLYCMYEVCQLQTGASTCFHAEAATV